MLGKYCSYVGYAYVCMCVCVRECMHVCVHACMCAYIYILLCILWNLLGANAEEDRHCLHGTECTGPAGLIWSGLEVHCKVSVMCGS